MAVSIFDLMASTGSNRWPEAIARRDLIQNLSSRFEQLQNDVIKLRITLRISNQLEVPQEELDPLVWPTFDREMTM